ncbi:WD40 repeat domain-containing protein [Sulfurimonas sp. CS5]|uniref:WD40 repeat domain-containing protein n=1 Tax=Sulfurimonas sp. CS5 TaxID=3391145 RepID=UPI0039E8EB09
MSIINDCQQARSEITAFTKFNDNSFAYSTKYHGAKIITKEECSVELSYKNENLNFNSTAVCFSPDAKFIAYATKTHLYIANISNKEVVKSIILDNDNIIILSFDLSSKYIVAGNNEGRVLLFKYNSSSQLARLCSFPYQRPKTKVKKNFVSAITFYRNLLAVSGYGGAIFIIDIYSGANKSVLLHGTSRKNALYFLNENSIISGDNDGNLQLISIPNNSVIKSINLPFRKTNQIISIPNTKYLIVHANTNTMIIIDSKEYKIIHNNYIEFEDDIHAIEALDSKTLVVSLKNQRILYVELPSREMLSSLILHNSLDAAYELIAKEPMLQETPEHKSLEQMYNKAYLGAVNALINQNKELANQLMLIYRDIEVKQESVKLLFKSFENYNRFKTLYLEKKYALAYAMSIKFPALKMTNQYNSMEIKWKETFTNAQRHILIGKPDYAKALFKEYMTVIAKRPIIQLILKHNELFIEFLRALDKKDFKKVNEIARKNILFTQMPIYETLESDIKKSLTRIDAYIKKNKIKLAKKSLAKIEGTPGFTQQVEILYSMCDEMIKLQNFYASNDFYSCYEMIDLFPHLGFSELGELLQKHWLKLMNECEEYALKGNIQSIKAVLGELITLNARKDRIGDLLRVSFQVQIKYFLSKQKFKSAQNVIYSYIDIFTKDNEISSLMSKYESLTGKKLAITLSQDKRLSRDSWRESKLIMD